MNQSESNGLAWFARYNIELAAVLGFLSVAAGAFGTHALSDFVTPARLNTFEVGARYQMYHALALLALSALPRTCRPAAAFWFLGSVIFSGSLYLLVLLNVPILGAVAPIGGLLQLLGWGWLFWGARQAVSASTPTFSHSQSDRA
jgi:uncharacterized membrane protein YgdD (TMEM256/DUF423 family)